MSAFINEIIVMGNLGKKPELKYFDNGVAHVRLNVATSEHWKDKEGQTHKETEWHSVLLRGALAERVAKFMDVGDKIYIRGKLKARQYTDSDGVIKNIHEIHAKEMKIIQTKNRKEGLESEEVESEDDDPLNEYM